MACLTIKSLHLGARLKNICFKDRYYTFSGWPEIIQNFYTPMCMTVIMARPYQQFGFDYSAQPDYPEDHIHVDESQVQVHAQEYDMSAEQGNIFTVSPSHYREAGAMQHRQSQYARQQHGTRQHFDQYPISPARRIGTRQIGQARMLRHQSLPHQQHEQEQMVTTSLSNPSASAYVPVDFSPVTFTPRVFRDDFRLSSQEHGKYSPVNESIGSGAVIATTAGPQSSHSDIVARDGRHGRTDIMMKYPHPSILPTVEQYQQHQTQKEQHSQPQQRSHQTRQASTEDRKQQHDRHGHRLPDRSPPSKVSRGDSTSFALNQRHRETLSLVGREGMPRPAQRPEGPKIKFTSEDDQLLVDLKEKHNLTWKQIAEFFPGRSSGTLQVRYCTKLKVKATVWTEESVSADPACKPLIETFIRKLKIAIKKVHFWALPTRSIIAAYNIPYRCTNTWTYRYKSFKLLCKITKQIDGVLYRRK